MSAILTRPRSGPSPITRILAGFRSLNKGQRVQILSQFDTTPLRSLPHHKDIGRLQVSKQGQRVPTYFSMLQVVLWIRIRKNPKVFAGSESEKKVRIRIRIGSRHCCRMKLFVKNRRSNTRKRKILCFSIEKIVPWRTDPRTHMKAVRGTIKILAKGSEFEKKLWIRIRKKWVRIHNTGYRSCP
jgi:hypothetical protein